MSQKEVHHEFNLLKPLEEPKDYWDRIYEWLTTRAKIVVLFVEILMVVAFVLKITVDNIGKNGEQEYEKLNIEATLLSTQYENEFREIQRNEIEYKKLWRNGSGFADILEEVDSYIENVGTDFSIKVDTDRINIFGYQDLESLRQLENSLKTSPTFSGAFIDDLSLRGEDVAENSGQYILTAIIKPELVKRSPIDPIPNQATVAPAVPTTSTQ